MTREYFYEQNEIMFHIFSVQEVPFFRARSGATHFVGCSPLSPSQESKFFKAPIRAEVKSFPSLFQGKVILPVPFFGQHKHK
mgnify:CR=1 FL=1